ncbi:MAG: OmpA family protein [Rhodospirillales bacterium]|nr:OmpA family protein [Rhodospirillales bacterium]
MTLLTGCVWKSDYDALQTENQSLQRQLQARSSELAASQAQVARLQGAIKYKVIARMAERLAPTQERKLQVNGYTDNAPIGPALRQEGITSNEMLSQKRAEAVRDFLISQGVKPDMIQAHGFGSANPVASNDTAAGRKRNRRVELTFASG